MNADGGQTLTSEDAPRIRRRAALYVGGLDPRGHRFLYQVYRGEFAKHIARTGVTGETSDVEPPPEGKPWLRRWRTRLDDGNGPVETVVDFLEWQDLIPRRRNVAALGRISSGLSVFATMVKKGIFRKSRWYGRGQYILALYPFVVLFLNIAIMIALPLIGLAVGAGHGWVWALAGLIFGGGLSAGYYWLTRKFDRRIFAWFLLDFWSYQRMQGADDPRIVSRFDLFTDHVLEVLADESYDEVVLFALSTGGYVCLNLIGAMLERDPDFASSGRHLTFVTFGVAPSVPGWFGPTERYLASLRQALSSRALTWVNYHIRKDPMSAKAFDPVRDFDLDPTGFRDPMMDYREIDLRVMLKPETLKGLRGNLFRKHLHYMMASETGEGHDFFDLICSPRPVLVAAGASPATALESKASGA